LLRAAPATGGGALRRLRRAAESRDAAQDGDRARHVRARQAGPARLMRVVVVGGGIAGLAAAARLVDDGHEVALYERRAQLGGRAYSVVDETTGDAIDNGQHVIMGCNSALRAFVARIGCEAEIEFQDRLDVAFLDGGRRVRLRAGALPAPFHL